ncbi:MAG: DUF1056 family protein [Campylobacteraceae bacterium]|jgi:hypothetical protein|nr:DUF1056 family protein [Campylobacteraceae bacterium]
MHSDVIGQILIILLVLIFIAVWIAACVWAYRCGERSGNVTIAFCLIVCGLLSFGATFIPGLCYLAGTSKHKHGMGIDAVKQDNRNLKNDKLKAEIDLLKKQTDKL